VSEKTQRQVELALVDALDHLLDRGVLISGEAMISVGSVDLLYLGLNVVLANVDTMVRVSERSRNKQLTDE
jgi:gas vesicle structural protein